MFRYGAASETFSRLLQLLTDSKCYFFEKCMISVPSVVNVYIGSIAAHVEAALYNEALILCDTVLDKCSLVLPSFNAVAANNLPQSQHSNDMSHPSVECRDVTRERNYSVSITDGDSIIKLASNKPIIAQIALYKAQALLELGRADEALLCVDRLVSLYC